MHHFLEQTLQKNQSTKKKRENTVVIVYTIFLLLLTLGMVYLVSVLVVEGFFDFFCFAVLLGICVLFQFVHQWFKRSQRYQVSDFPLSWQELLYITLVLPLILCVPVVLLVVARWICGGNEFYAVWLWLLMIMLSVSLLMGGVVMGALIIFGDMPNRMERERQEKIMGRVRELCFSQWLEKLSVVKTKKELWKMLDAAWDPEEKPMVHVGALSTFYRTYRNLPLEETIQRAAGDYFTFHNLPLISKIVGVEIVPGEVGGREK